MVQFQFHQAFLTKMIRHPLRNIIVYGPNGTRVMTPQTEFGWRDSTAWTDFPRFSFDFIRIFWLTWLDALRNREERLRNPERGLVWGHSYTEIDLSIYPHEEKLHLRSLICSCHYNINIPLITPKLLLTWNCTFIPLKQLNISKISTFLFDILYFRLTHPSTYSLPPQTQPLPTALPQPSYLRWTHKRLPSCLSMRSISTKPRNMGRRE